MKLFIFCLELAFYGSISWVSIIFFKTENQGAKKGRLFIGIAAGVATLLELYDILHLRNENYMKEWASAFLFIVALVVFWWTYFTVKSKAFSFAYSDVASMHLVIIGPFKWVRHPFYTTYILGWFAAFLTTNTIQALLISIGMFVVYWNAAKKEELQFLSSNLAAEYSDYQKRAGAFFPKIF